MGKTLQQLKEELQRLENPKQAEILSRFFKTGKGQYGEGDIFLGIKVPEQRRIAKKYQDISIKELHKMLLSKIHEERLISLFILITKYKKADMRGKKEIAAFYLKNTKQINNWDLVDLSAANILGNYLLDKVGSTRRNRLDPRLRDRAVLYKLAKSNNLWERRIAIMTTFALIRNNEFEDTLNIAELLLKDRHDLIHKAAGWMLREVGKRDLKTEEAFLKNHCKHMPRTMLRYAIERFDEEKRKRYLKK